MARHAPPYSMSLFCLVSLFCTISICNPILASDRSQPFEDDTEILKRQGGIFSILGVAGVADKTPYPRLEVRVLEKQHPDQWNIYLLGLQRFQSVSQDDKLSYFQIAGIHGKPYSAWDGVQGDPNSLQNGYCTHESNLFPTWHRPYLALFEEVLYLHAREVISEFPVGDLKNRSNAALKTFRMPYWDWAAVPPEGEGSMPWSIQRPTINVTLPNGSTPIPNPLYSYKFHPTPDWKDGDGKWNAWPSTLRNPTSNDANAQSQNNAVALELDGNRQNMQSRVYNLLAFQHQYLNMSNKLIEGDSLESIHGSIHDTVGGDAHMTWLDYSAFDPSFWLHHANVDRLLAIWQELNRFSWISAHTNPDPTFAIPASTSADGRTPLKPFHKDDRGNFWTSDDIRGCSVFGYTYPELMGRTQMDTLISRVNNIYGPNATPLLKRGAAATGAANFEGKRQYTADIKVRQLGFKGSIKFYVFLGEPSTEQTCEWATQPNFVGVASILASRRQILQEANTMIPLTAALETKVRTMELESMEEDRVAAYLTEKMSWRMVAADGSILSNDTAPAFSFSILWQEIEPAPSVNEFPSPQGEPKVLLAATDVSDGSFNASDA